ncbi:MAG: N-6 DNA methylase [Chloroflexi bacterium]|nr:N-6 DNA methylase [Chloroflexota bacterium]
MPVARWPYGGGRRMKPEEKARQRIDDLLEAAGWRVQDRDQMNLHECDLHTLLRLPTGIFYAQGVKANVLFFDRKPASETPWTKALWIYDLRTNVHFTLKQNPLTRADLDEFVACYNPTNRHERTPTWSEDNPDGRWRCFTCDDLMARDKVNLDIFWLRDESLEDTANLPNPDVLAAEIADDLQAALEQFSEIAADLGE